MKIKHLDYITLAAVFLVVVLTDAKAVTIDFDDYQFGDLGYTSVHSRWTDAGFNALSPVQFHTTSITLGSTAKYMEYNDDWSVSNDWFYSGGSFEISWGGLADSVSLDIASNYGDDFNIHGRQYHAWVTYGDGSNEDFLLPLEENPRITTVPWEVVSDLGIRAIHFGDENGAIRPQGYYAIGIDNLVVDNITQTPIPAAFWLFGTALLGAAGLSRRVMT
jgi:hypothetical protein